MTPTDQLIPEARVLELIAAARNPDLSFTEIECVRGDFKVVWEALGEGLSEFFDPEDPDDYPHLRFSCYQRAQEATQDPAVWDERIDASYCTRLPISTPPALLEKAAQPILDAIEHSSYKRRLEELSWLCLEDFKAES